MANWQRTLRLNPEWKQYQNDEISRQELAASIGRKMSAMRPFEDYLAEVQRKDLAETFEDMSRDDDLPEDEFNGVLNDLYDWGDTALDSKWNGKKVCWVDAISAPPPPTEDQ